MFEGSEFQTEGAMMLKPRRQRLCGLKEPTTDWCWRSH